MTANKTPEGRNLNNRMQARFIGRGLRRKKQTLVRLKGGTCAGCRLSGESVICRYNRKPLPQGGIGIRLLRLNLSGFR